MEELLDFDLEENMSIKEFVKVLLVSVLVLKIIELIFPFCIVKGFSMENTLQDEQTVILNRLSYIIEEPKRGDIVVIDVDKNNNTKIAGKTIVKRIVGLPGEHLEINNNEIYINGEKLKEDYIKEKMSTRDIDILIPLNEFFVMGDNRNNSGDSRDFGSFNLKEIEAKVMFEK